MSNRSIDEQFLALPMQQLADAALQAARDGGASYAAFRMERILATMIRLRDAELEGVNNAEDIGYSVRVVVMARGGSLPMSNGRPRRPLALRVEPSTWPRSAHRSTPSRSTSRLNPAIKARGSPTTRPIRGGAERRQGRAPAGVESTVARRRRRRPRRHLAASVKENKFYADLAGTSRRSSEFAFTRARSGRHRPQHAVRSRRCATTLRPLGEAGST